MGDSYEEEGGKAKMQSHIFNKLQILFLKKKGEKKKMML